MNFLNKVENIYLTILRLVVITVATIALALSLFLGVSSAFKLGAEPKDDAAISSINSLTLDGFISSQSPKDSNASKVEDIKKTESSEVSSDLDTAVKNTSKYVNDVFGGEQSPEVTRLHLVDFANGQLSEKYRGKYFKSANEFSSQLLSKITDQRAIVAAYRANKNTQPNGFININDAWKWHDSSFINLVRKNESDMDKTHEKYALAKASAIQDLYIAAGSFASFLLVVFLFIIIKIERNLRGASISASGNL